MFAVHGHVLYGEMQTCNFLNTMQWIFSVVPVTDLSLFCMKNSLLRKLYRLLHGLDYYNNETTKSFSIFRFLACNMSNYNFSKIEIF